MFASVWRCWSTLLSDCIRSGVRQSFAIMFVRSVEQSLLLFSTVDRCRQHEVCLIRRMAHAEDRANNQITVLVELHQTRWVDDLPF